MLDECYSVNSSVALSTVFLVLFFACSAVHVVGEFLEDPKKQRVHFASKPFLMPLLIVYYYTSAIEAGFNVNVLIAFGVALGFVGDVSLLWPKKQAFFIVGLFAFLLGHVLYVVAFISAMNAFSTVPWWFYFTAIGFMGYFYVSFRLFRPYLKEMLVPVAVYLTLLLTMSFIALAVVVSATVGNVRQPWYLFLGSLSFIASDSLLANQIFRKPFKYDQAIIMITYILAQFFIVQAYLG